MTKAPQAFRTISEVSETLDVPQHVLRFWEGKFPHIKPMKRAGGRRYYRPDDIELLRGIRALLYAEGYTIKGVQKVLRDSGVRYVSEIGRYGAKRNSRAEAINAKFEHAKSEALEHPDEYDFDENEELVDVDAGAELTLEPSEIASGKSLGLGEDPAGNERRAMLEAALQELLALRDMLRAVRPKKPVAA